MEVIHGSSLPGFKLANQATSGEVQMHPLNHQRLQSQMCIGIRKRRNKHTEN